MIGARSTVIFHFDIKLADGSAAESTRVHNKPARLQMGDGSLSAAFEAQLLGLVAGAWGAAVASRQWTPRRPTWRDAARGLAGGALLGWGAMTGLGCTIGTLLSGSMAGALSGWVFGAAVFTALWLGFVLRRWQASRD